MTSKVTQLRFVFPSLAYMYFDICSPLSDWLVYCIIIVIINENDQGGVKSKDFKDT